MRIPWGTFSEELWVIILGNLPKSDLRRLCCASKHLYAIIVPILYQVIDLSIHHLEVRSASDPKIASIHVRQFLLVRQVLLKPELGSYVRSFTWTMNLHTMHNLPAWIDDKKISWTMKDIYYMFELLNRAQYVDLDTGSRHVEPIYVIPSLFPNASSIRLGGKMHFKLAAAILHGANKAPLEALSLNNVQEGGLLSNNTYFRHFNPANIYPRAQGDLSTFKENWLKDSPPIQVGPGSMRRLLTPPLHYRCKHLHYLSLFKQGQNSPHQYAPSSRTYEDAVYHEWASFLQATHPNIIVFAHGRSPPIKPSTWQCRLPPPIPPEHLKVPDISPMDERFRNTILPVLKNAWPGLKKIEVRGVSVKVLDQLEIISGVEVVIDEDVRICYNGIAGMD